MTINQVALAAGVATVLAGWCLRRAVQFGPPPVAVTYRRLYATRVPVTAPPIASAWDRWFAPIGARLAGSDLAERFGARRRFAFRAAGVSLPLLVTRTIAAAVIGFIAGLVATLVPVNWPWRGSVYEKAIRADVAKSGASATSSRPPWPVAATSGKPAIGSDSCPDFATMRSRPGRSVTNMRPSGRNCRPQG